MKLLITNDDSISSEILLPLAGWAKQFGEVTVIVPRYEQSGKSHCVEFRKPFEVKQVHQSLHGGFHPGGLRPLCHGRYAGVV